MLTRQKILIKLLEKYSSKKVLFEAFNESEIDFIVKPYGFGNGKSFSLINKSNKQTIVSCASKEENSILYIVGMYTTSEYRHQGNGYLFLQKIIQYCKKNSYKSIILDVEKNNLNAIKLYKKIGFVEYEGSSYHTFFGVKGIIIHMKLDL